MNTTYDTYDVDEYYVFDPERNTMEVWIRQEGRLRKLSHLKTWTSPRLGCRFALGSGTLEIHDPSGQPFLSSVERSRRAKQEMARAERETARAEREAARAEQEAARAEREHNRSEQLAKRLRAMGIDPDWLED